jgi:hypothetical protein
MNLFAIGAGDFVSPGTDDVPTIDLSFTLEATAPTNKFSYVMATSPHDANVYGIAFATAPLSTGIQVVTTQMRQISTIQFDGSASYNLVTEFNTKFGNLTAGMKNFAMLRGIDKRSGLAGVDFSANIISS